jgi:hypothetical protein
MLQKHNNFISLFFSFSSFLNSSHQISSNNKFTQLFNNNEILFDFVFIVFPAFKFSVSFT